ncbi:MAG: GntR family transcriptional regulator [Muribaculaceae bacterium]|nr:GntR family transcriptional regulator [Muribaculaceae bacterium]MDE5969138.1 GntR family transcriptional regulator [Muribaculaceae bacterium]MDE7394175.1 GntR family transcriptional regulator [Muribaculaceae bacterium]
MDDIVEGIYPPDNRLPSVRELSARMQVNANTIVRTFEILEREGVAYNRRGMGYFVAPDAVGRILSARRKEFFENDSNLFFSRLSQFDITPEALADLYRKWLSKNA